MKAEESGGLHRLVFSVRMADGKEMPITHPDAMAWGDERPRRVLSCAGRGMWRCIDLAPGDILEYAGPVVPAESL